MKEKKLNVKKEKKKGIIGPLIFATVSVGFAYGVFQLSSSIPEPEPRQLTQEEINLAAARRACREIISGQLHDPDSAEWGNVSLWRAGPQTDNPNRILVQPEIRARNAFGALVLTRFQCTFSVDGDDLGFVGIREY